MSAVTLPPTASLGQLLEPAMGIRPTTALRFWRALTLRVSMLVSRFRAWHAIEPRRDAVASYAALGVGCAATLLALVAL